MCATPPTGEAGFETGLLKPLVIGPGPRAAGSRSLCGAPSPLALVNNLFLAPLAGVGDAAFRMICMGRGAGLCFTEMVSAQGLVRGQDKTLALAALTPAERPAGIQLFGSDPAVMEEAAGRCASLEHDLLDINAGCPVRKVLRTGAGAGLLDDPGRLYRVVAACARASAVPVSVKMRLGLNEERIAAREAALAAQEAGASLITLHPRTAAAGYAGRARWEYIALVKEAVAVPVCGSGDVRCPADAVRMLRETGCDAVMIGRAAAGNPWIISDTLHALSGRPVPPGPGPGERIGQALEHLSLAVSLKGEPRGVRETRVHLHRYLRGLPGAARARDALNRAEDSRRVRELLTGFLRELGSPPGSSAGSPPGPPPAASRDSSPE
ncbi:MAG: tRNA dihydrouridine synthase DusB [Spirochaetota bacterium]